MDNLQLLRQSFVAFVDGLWWGLRDNTGPLSMYDGYERGFKQMGIEAAEAIGGSGPEGAAKICGSVMGAIGLKVEISGSEISVTECPLWNRILERGLEFAFHIEEICWKPLLEGIAEKTGTKAQVVTSLRLNHIAKAKIDYKKGKMQRALDSGNISKEEYDKAISSLEANGTKIPKLGKYKFE